MNKDTLVKLNGKHLKIFNDHFKTRAAVDIFLQMFTEIVNRTVQLLHSNSRSIAEVFLPRTSDCIQLSSNYFFAFKIIVRFAYFNDLIKRV